MHLHEHEQSTIADRTTLQATARVPARVRLRSHHASSSRLCQEFETVWKIQKRSEVY